MKLAQVLGNDTEVVIEGTLLVLENLMECPRCQGTMVVDHFVDLATSGEIWMPGWRCLMCGEIVDPLIEDNRQQQRQGQEGPVEISQSTAQLPTPLAVGSSKGPSSSS